MNRLLVNIRGCNGAGKSTIPMCMMDDPAMYIHTITWEGKTKKAATVFPTYGWVALGTYFNKTGGLDVLQNNAITEEILLDVLKTFPDYDVLMEGVIASTIKSTYANLFHRVEALYDRKILILSIVTPLKICLERIQERNGGKPIKEDVVENKWKIVARNVEYFKDQGFTSIRVNTAKIKKDKVLRAFFKTVEKHREG